jgi:hypothetical protein
VNVIIGQCRTDTVWLMLPLARYVNISAASPVGGLFNVCYIHLLHREGCSDGVFHQLTESGAWLTRIIVVTTLWPSVIVVSP